VALEQIGQKLKNAREGQGLTLAQIYERTKIPVNHLQAIDTGIADDLPEPVYVAGFIKRYAECVGLNGQNLSDEYRKQATPERSGNGDSSWGSRSNVAQPVLVSAPYVHRSRIEDRPPNILKSLFFPMCWIVLIFGLITFLYNLQQRSDTNPDSLVKSLPQSKFDKIQPSAAPDASQSATQTGPTVASTAAPATPPTASSDVQLSFTASQHVWVDIKSVSTGESLYIGNLESGDRRDYKDPQGIRIVAGNGASITVDVDGKTATLGPAGRRAEKVFMAKNPVAPAAGTTIGPDGTIKPLGTTASGTAIKPPVKRIIKKPVTDAALTPKRRFRPVDDSPSRSIPGESVGGSRSIDVPYRYTEGRDSGE
jgi:cytoskeletal protein RodZ